MTGTGRGLNPTPHHRLARNIIFDRCPLDFIAYILASPGAERFDTENWQAPVTAAYSSLDLIVAVRMDPDYDSVRVVDDAAFRTAVDRIFRC